MRTFKIETFVPCNYFEELKKALLKLDCIGQIGKYANCMNWYEVNSTWTPTKGATPFFGEVGKQTIAKEIKIEFNVKECDLPLVIKTIKDNHPYEEVGINIMELYSQNNE